jgi:NitT/TauT family transport system substrate-binding protein
MLNRRRFLALATTSVAVLALLDSSASAQTLTPVRIALFPSESTAQVYYAQDLGFFKNAGLDVQLVELKNGAAIAAGVAGGAADVGISNMVSLAIAHERGLPFTVIMPGGLALASAPTNGILGVGTSSPIKTAKDLNGKIVAVDVLGGLPHLAGKAWIDANGGDSKTVKYVEVPFAEMIAAVQAGRIDAASLNLSVDPTIGKPGDPLRTLAVVYDAVAPKFASSMWFTTNDWAAQHADATKKLAGALRQAAQWANGHHHESAAILAKYIKMPAEQIESGARVVYGTENDAPLYQPLVDLAAKYGSLKATFPVQTMMVR